MTDLADRLAGLSPAKRALLEKMLASQQAAAPAPPIPRIPDGPAPLSAEQRRLWYVLQLAPGYPVYTVPLGFRLRGPLDVDALAAALRGLVARHEALRTAFRESMVVPVQVVGDGAGFALEVADLRGQEWAEPEANYQTDAFARRAFDYARGETFRALLLREADDEARLLLGLHHLAGDGWSAGVLLRDLGALYAAHASGAAPSLPDPPVRFRDWAAWQQRPDAPPPAADEAYWREQLDGAPRVLEVPPDRPRPPLQGWDGAKHPFEIPPPLTEAVRALARREGATPYAVTAAALALLLGRHAAQDDLLLGTVLANRPRPELEGVVGFFANTLPLRLRLGGDPTAGELVRRAHAAALGAQEHAGLPFDRIVELAGARRDFSRPPLVQAVLTFTESTVAALSLPGVDVEPLELDSRTAAFELTLAVDDRGDHFSAALQYATDLFEPATIARMADHLRSALAGLAADPARRISRIPLTTDDEARTVDAWSRATSIAATAPEPASAAGDFDSFADLVASTWAFSPSDESQPAAESAATPVAPAASPDPSPSPETASPEDGVAEEVCIHALFERQARATPERTAVVCGSEAVSYAALNRRANRIAHGLRRLGVGPETRVAVCLERTPALVAALLGVLKAGGAYVPLDPGQPPARHAAVLGPSGARLALVDNAARPLPPDVRAVLVAELEGSGEDGDDGDPAPLAAPGNLAYVIFTSGSTGGPKGVEIEHRSAAALLAWTRALLDDEERAGVMASSSVTFDFSVVQLFGVLAWGGTVVLLESALAAPPPGIPLPTACLVPTAAAELLREGRFPAGARTLLTGGEPVPPALVDALFARTDVRRVLNLYGPAEDTTCSTCAALEPGAGRVSIGRAIPGGRVYVLDEGLHHAGAAVPGELWTAGAGVARGYAGRPALTAERFVPDPYGPPGSRMYRTLDRGRWREDGLLEYLGRGDAQVKVRGYRIELEEVEQALAAHPDVAEAAVAARGEPGGDRRLAAFLVAGDTGARPAPAGLRAWLRERLPEYMVPGAFAWVDALPRTPGGKLDRRALPEADDAPAGPPYVAPRTELEERLAALWREVLGVERVGLHDDFFDLGGQSILATRLVGRIRDELGAEVAVAGVLTAPTLEQMAQAVAGGRRGAEGRILVPLQTFGERPPLFLAHPAGGHVVCYRGLAVLLAMEQPVYALQPRGVEGGGAPLESVEEMAARYVAEIRALRPRGPYRLGGWSFGGVLAWEMARQLDAAGETVDLLALFDTSPSTPDVVPVDAGDPAEVVWQTVAGLAGHAAASRVDVSELRGLEGRELVRAMIRGMNAPQLLPESRVDDVLALTAVRAANLQAQGGYRPEPYRGHLTYFRTAGSDDAGGRSPGLEFWSALALGGTTVHPVGGNHGTILHEPYVNTLAQVILAAGDPKT